MKAAMGLAALALAGAAQAVDDPLRAAVHCEYEGGLRAMGVSHHPAGSLQRTVATSSGPMTVSVVDGYRVYLGFPGTDPFVNLKLERSAPGRLDADRTAILAQMTSFAAQPKAPPLKILPSSGIEVMGLDQPSLTDRGGVVGMYTLIAPASGVIATAYLLRQDAARSAFADYPRYTLLRDRFLHDLAACLGGSISAGRPIPPRS